MQAYDGAPPVGGVLAPLDQAMVLELPRQLAHRGQREAERRGELGGRLLALGPDVSEEGHMPPAERRVAVDEREQLAGRAPAAPQAAHHAPEGIAELRELLLFCYHRITIIESEGGGERTCVEDTSTAEAVAATRTGSSGSSAFSPTASISRAN